MARSEAVQAARETVKKLMDYQRRAIDARESINSFAEEATVFEKRADGLLVGSNLPYREQSLEYIEAAKEALAKADANLAYFQTYVEQLIAEYEAKVHE